MLLDLTERLVYNLQVVSPRDEVDAEEPGVLQGVAEGLEGDEIRVGAQLLDQSRGSVEGVRLASVPLADPYRSDLKGGHTVTS